MAKAKATKTQHNKTDLQNLSKRDRDYLTLETQQTMKKYNVGKQSVYDRKYSLNKKIQAAGMSVNDFLNTPAVEASAPIKKVAVAKKSGQKPGRKPNQHNRKQEEKQAEPIGDIVKEEKPSPIAMIPIVIKFENFSVKLNGVPKRISVNLDTNAIEIDL